MTPDGTGPRPVRRRRPRLIDWRHGARLLAAGLPVAAVAAALRIETEHVWRHLARSHRFRGYVRQALVRRKDEESVVREELP